MLPDTHSVLGNSTTGHRKPDVPIRQRHPELVRADWSLPTLRETAGSGVRAGGALKNYVRLPVTKQNAGRVLNDLSR